MDHQLDVARESIVTEINIKMAALDEKLQQITAHTTNTLKAQELLTTSLQVAVNTIIQSQEKMMAKTKIKIP